MARREFEVLGALGSVATIVGVVVANGHQIVKDFSNWFVSLSHLMARQSFHGRIATDVVLLGVLAVLVVLAGMLFGWRFQVSGVLLTVPCLGTAAFYICAVWDIAAIAEIVIGLCLVIFGGVMGFAYGWDVAESSIARQARRRTFTDGVGAGFLSRAASARSSLPANADSSPGGRYGVPGEAGGARGYGVPGEAPISSDRGYGTGGSPPGYGGGRRGYGAND